MFSYDQAANVGWGTLNDVFSAIHKGIMIINRLENIIGENPGDRTKEIYLAFELRFYVHIFIRFQVEVWGRYGHFQEKKFTMNLMRIC